MSRNGQRCLSDDCEGRDAIIDLLIAHSYWMRGEFLEIPIRKLCLKCREAIDGLIKRRLTAKIDL